MAKKIYFQNVNTTTIETINNILDITFVNAFERKELSKELKTVEKELADFMENPANKDKSTLEFQKKITLIKNKREALRKWTDATLRDHKNNSDQWENGLFSEVGVTREFCEIYLECRDNETWGKWKDAIKTMLKDTYGMSLDDKLVGKFANYLEHQVGSTCTGINQVLKGQLLKAQTVRNFSEIMVRAIATYMAKTNCNVTIPTAEFYVAKVTYDKNVKTVEQYEVLEKIEEK